MWAPSNLSTGVGVITSVSVTILTVIGWFLLFCSVVITIKWVLSPLTFNCLLSNSLPSLKTFHWASLTAAPDLCWTRCRCCHWRRLWCPHSCGTDICTWVQSPGLAPKAPGCSFLHALPQENHLWIYNRSMVHGWILVEPKLSKHLEETGNSLHSRIVLSVTDTQQPKPGNRHQIHKGVVFLQVSHGLHCQIRRIDQ